MALASKHNISVKTQSYAKSWSKHSLVEHSTLFMTLAAQFREEPFSASDQGFEPQHPELWALNATPGLLESFLDCGARFIKVLMWQYHRGEWSSNIGKCAQYFQKTSIIDHAKAKSEYPLLFLPTAVTLSCINARGLFWNFDKRWRHHCHINKTGVWLFMLMWPWFWRPQDKLEAARTITSE